MSNYGSVTRTQYDAPANGFLLNPYKSVRSIYELFPISFNWDKMSGLRLLFRCLFRGMFHSGNHFRGERAGGTSWSTTPKWTLVLDPTVHQSTPEYTGCIGQSWSTPEYARVHWSTLEYTGVHWSTLEYTRVRKSTLECTGVHWSTLEYTGVH